MKDRFESISSSIGTVIEITKETYEILGGIYGDEHIVARSVEVLGDNIYKIKFIFPEYKLLPGLQHVSGVQMQLALYQGLFLAIGLFVKNTGEPISYDTFLNNRKTAKYRKEEKEYIHELKFGEEGYLIIEVVDVKNIRDFYMIESKLLSKKVIDTKGQETKTFLRGTCTCILEKNYI